MEQKILRLAKKLNKFTIDDLVMTLEEDFEELAQKSSLNISTPSNPRKANKNDFLEMFQKAFCEK